MSARLRSERGVALVEALVAVAILGMTLVVFLSGISTGLVTTGQSDRLSTAHELARSQIEYDEGAVCHAAPYSYRDGHRALRIRGLTRRPTRSAAASEIQLITVKSRRTASPSSRSRATR